VPDTSYTTTRCSPIGLGRSDERVAKTPVKGLVGTSRGVNLEDLPIRAMQPRDHRELISFGDAA
jgi:hypothetical protein